jgi:hypothetical protein
MRACPPFYNAGVVKLVDTPDSKSGAFKSVPVQVRPPVPITSTDKKGNYFLLNLEHTFAGR